MAAADARYSGYCGTPLNTAQPPHPAPASPSVKAGLSAASEYKQVTVLLADLVSSTEFIARLDLEDAMRTLQSSLQIMREAVERFGGTVIRTMGDGMMALFGAPRATEGHALLACQAALAIRDAIARRPTLPFVIVGLHSGKVVADAPESDPLGERLDQGLAIHLASRLLAQVGPGEMWL
jgi:adenylate cyclase